MRTNRDRVVQMGRAQLASLAIAWKYPPVSQLEIEFNPSLRSTLARWMPSSNVLGD
jgi:hypothetical protein